tara:strand:+ start:1028 stop:1351 length:324 start_codon:yes stop_codon:yes gene_type:complete
MVSLFVMAIIITSIATYLSRLLGVITSEKISEESKLFRWFNCLAYSTLAALIARIIVFPSGSLNETNIYLRILVVLMCIGIFFITKRNLVYPTVLSCILLSVFNIYI